jgi:CDP-diacylglycerol--serine O-phosphatidyltransferase
MAMNQKFEHAAWAIFIAMVLDGLDGRVARLTNTQSEFGAQYDSLSDMVSFGAAPALVVYEWSLRGWASWVGSRPLSAPPALLRLARFNTNIEVVDKRYFQGMPSPSAAALMAGIVLMMVELEVSGLDGLGLVGHRRVCRPDHGQQRAVLQLQGHQLPQVGAVHRRCS